jgi:hypothetical protein
VKRIIPVVAILALAAVAAFAVPPFGGPGPYGAMPPYVPGAPTGEAGPYLSEEIQRIGAEQGPQKLGDLDVAGLFALRDRLSVAAQKDQYVRTIALHSYVLPGLGQMETGHTAEGVGFLAADVATLAGTFVVAYYLLPRDLRFDRLDYFGSDIGSINDAWEAHTFKDYLPACGALLVGMIVDQTLRHWSAADARRDATRAIDARRVTFTPKVGLGVLGFEVSY